MSPPSPFALFLCLDLLLDGSFVHDTQLGGQFLELWDCLSGNNGSEMLLTMIEESIEMLSMHARNVISLLPCETADTHLDGTIDPPPLHEQLHRVGSLATEKEQLCLAGLVCWQFLLGTSTGKDDELSGIAPAC